MNQPLVGAFLLGLFLLVLTTPGVLPGLAQWLTQHVERIEKRAAGRPPTRNTARRSPARS
jgi:hypothetical protein